MVFRDSSKGLPGSGKWRQSIDIYDVNGDGYLDILAPSPRLPSNEEDRRPHVWYGDGKGGWSEARLRFPQGSRFFYGGICGGDFDGDGITDLALAMHTMGLKGLRGNGKGGYEAFSDGLPSEEVFTSRAVVAADVNNDGTPDVVSVSELFPKGPALSSGGRLYVCLGSKGGWKCQAFGHEAVRRDSV
ncbi:MAG: VCBS repeat-containing protein [Deltaproteobacteria bacterium]|nr:VCBS repeat-containing protein [Deltaproteobacteria bacterium]